MSTIKVKYSALEGLEGFEEVRGKLVWSDVIGEYMGFSIVRAYPSESEDGYADFEYTDEFIFNGSSKESACTDERNFEIIELRLTALFNKYNIEYELIKKEEEL